MKSSFSSSTSHCVTCADDGERRGGWCRARGVCSAAPVGRRPPAPTWSSVHDAIRSCARSFVTVSDETARRPRFRVRSCAFVHCSKRSSSFELTSVFRRPTSRDCPGPPAPTGPVGVELRFSPPIIGADIRRATIRDCAACALLLLKIPLDCPFWSCSFAFAAADPEELAAFAISGFRGDAAADEDDAPFDGDGDGSIVATTSDGFATSCAVKSLLGGRVRRSKLHRSRVLRAAAPHDVEKGDGAALTASRGNRGGASRRRRVRRHRVAEDLLREYESDCRGPLGI